MWIASLNGLWKIDYEKGIAEKIGKENGFQDDRVMCIREASAGRLWLGTYSGGIHIYNPKSGSVRIIDENDGLSNNTVVGLLQDNEGYWWAATYDGITVLSETGQALFELSENEGISHREFNRFSYLKTGDGKLLFGTVDGVNLLDPERIKAQFNTKESLQIYLTDVTYFDKKTEADIHWKDQTSPPEQIIIPADKRYIEVDFGLSNYNNPEKNNFFYRISRPGQELEASEEDRWTSIGYNSELILNDLPTGDYTILIKALNYKGQWTEKPIAVKISVQEFFYKMLWFYLLITIPIAGVAWFWIRRLSTEKKRMEAEVEKRTLQIQQDKALIEKQAEELKELDELKSRFFTNISHEFRTPLTVISGMITQMEQQPERWMQKGIELIKRNSHQLLSLINQILDLRKLESGALQPNLIRADVIPFLQYLADSFVPMAQSKGIRIHFIPNCSGLEMDYDPDKLLHILSNLLSNAIKYTSGPGDIYCQVDRRVDAGREMLTIQLRDTGKGISPEALPYIFDRFYQVEDLASQKPQGSGIGLALTKELVKLLDGTIQVDSKLGAGTTFSLFFPVRREASYRDEGLSPYFARQNNPGLPNDEVPAGMDDVPNPAQLAHLPDISPEEDMPVGSDSQPTLLIVEDNPDVRLYLTSCLEKEYYLIYAENGQEGIDTALENVPDIILSDVMMPVKDGFALCDTLKHDERTSHIPIVMLTAKADFESRMQGLRKRADAYLSKPFEQEELLVTLDNLLEIRKQLQLKYTGGLSSATENGGEPTPATVPDVEDAFLKKLKQVVVQHLEDADLSGEFICREMNMSRTNLYRKLKALTDLSISHFVRQVRLQQAKELLLHTDKNISEVAYEVGFIDPKYFSRIFSETFQQSPSHFREK